MSAKDKYHHIVKIALKKEGWHITHDPYLLGAGSFDLEIDLGAENVIAAERGAEKIAVEIKSFLGASKISQFYGALGQFITSRSALTKQEPERILYLAVPRHIYDRYQLVYVGWREEERVYGVVLHVDIVDGKFWIQQDGTEVGIANELVDIGVPRSDIVLGFDPPMMRKSTDFAVG